MQFFLYLYHSSSTVKLAEDSTRVWCWKGINHEYSTRFVLLKVIIIESAVAFINSCFAKYLTCPIMHVMVR